MRDDELELVLRRLSGGETLSSQEFDALATRAQAEPVPRWRVAVVQALLNCERPGEAERLAQALARDFPNHAEVLLALAQVLVAQERFREAQGVLRRLLDRNPHDVDALSALAALCLRSGEAARARELAERALAIDPFQAEAQHLLAELDASAAALPVAKDPPETKRDFLRALREQLTARAVPYLIHRGALLLKLGSGGVARVDVHELFADVKASGQPLDEGAAVVAEELAERSLGLPETPQALLAAVVPVLRDVRFLEASEGLAHREGPAGLVVFYAVSRPDLTLFVPQGLLDRLQLDADLVDEAATANLEARSVAVRPVSFDQGALVFTDQPTGLWAIAGEDGLDAGRLLTRSQRAEVVRTLGTRDFAAWLGLRELALVCRADDATWLTRLSETSATAQGIDGLFRFEEEVLVEVNVWAERLR